MKSLIFKIHFFLTNTFFFKILYLIVSISLTSVLKFIPGIHILNKALLLWGIFLIIYNILSLILNKKYPNIIQIPLYLFLFFTSIFLIKYFSIENLKIIIVNFILLTAIFTIDYKKDINKLKKEIKIISFIYVIITFLLSIGSLLMFFFDKRTWIAETLNGTYTVYYFTSLFTNENTLGISASLSLLISIYLINCTKIKNIKLFNILNLLIQFITVFVSNSRSALIPMITLIFLYILFYIKNKILRVILIFSPVIAVSSILLTNLKSIDKFLTGRKELWDSAFEIIRNNFFFGVGNSQLPILLEKSQNKVVTSLIEQGFLGGIHNIYIQILATNGIIPLLLIILFILSVTLFIFNKIDLSKLEKEFIPLFSLIVSISLINLLESNLVYIISFISIIFWIYTGYLLAILEKQKK